MQKAEFQPVQNHAAAPVQASVVPKCCRSRGIPVFPPSGTTYGKDGGVLTNIWKDRHTSEITRFLVRKQKKVWLVFEEGPSVMGLLLGGLSQ